MGLGFGIRVQGPKMHRIPDPDPQHWLDVRERNPDYHCVGVTVGLVRTCRNFKSANHKKIGSANRKSGPQSVTFAEGPQI
jgi:hypothetical protein